MRRARLIIMTDLLLRFFFGGIIISAFAILSDIFRPKSFAGLFGAAPSVALATLLLTITHSGRLYAATEGRSMIAGAIGTPSSLLIRYTPPALIVTLFLHPLWLGISFGLWAVFLR